MKNSIKNNHNSEILDRLPPQALEAEMGLLGAVILNPGVLDETLGGLRAEDFYADHHRILWATMCAMHSEGVGIDTLTLLRRLEGAAHVDRVGGSAYLAELIHAVPYHGNAQYYAASIIDQSRRRRVINAATEMMRAAWDQTEDTDGLIQRCESELQAIPTGGYNGEPMPLRMAVVEACVMVDEIASRRRPAGLMIGLERFDSAIGGLFPRELTILAARPSVGKTAMAVQIALYVAGKGHRVYFASIEMGDVELALRMLCGRSGVSMRRVRSGDIDAADGASIVSAGSALHGLPIVLHDRPAMTVGDMRRACRRMTSGGLDLVIVDYLQRITPSDTRESRHLQIGRISGELKELAKELSVPVMALCQLSRAAEDVERPQLRHLKESGDIEQDADMVILLHRKHRENFAELILAKNRNGPQVEENLLWEPALMQFTQAETAATEIW